MAKTDISIASLNNARRASEAWLRKYKDVTPGRIVEEHKQKIDICKLAQKSLLLENPFEATRIHPEALELAIKAYDLLTNPLSYKDSHGQELQIHQILTPLGVNMNRMNYDQTYGVTVPKTKDLIVIMHLIMMDGINKY